MSQMDPDHIVAHTASAGAVVGVLMGWFPVAAAVFASLVAGTWYALQIWESNTVQSWRPTKRLINWWRSVFPL